MLSRYLLLLSSDKKIKSKKTEENILTGIVIPVDRNARTAGLPTEQIVRLYSLIKQHTSSRSSAKPRAIIYSLYIWLLDKQCQLLQKGL